MKKIKFNPVLYLFYVELWAWIVAGCSKHPCFQKEAALCGQLDNWIDHNFSWVDNYALLNTLGAVSHTQSSLFERDYGECGFPFNAYSNEFYDECGQGKTYKNIHRSAFVYHYSQQYNWF